MGLFVSSFVEHSMVSFLPFKALLPDPQAASGVVTRPFDSYSKEEIRQLLKESPMSFLHVIVPVADELENRRLSYEERLKLGKKEFEFLLRKGALQVFPEPAYYIYRQTDGNGNSFLGIMGAASVHDYHAGLIKKHEATLEYKEVVLKEYVEVIDIHAEPVYLTLPDQPELTLLLKEHSSGQPLISVQVNGRLHEVWPLSESEATEKVRLIFEEADSMYIADGHHRCASSALYGMERMQSNPLHSGLEPYNGFLAVVIPESGTRLYEFSRLVKDLGDLGPETFLSMLQRDFVVEQVSKEELAPKAVHEFGLYLHGQAFRLSLKMYPSSDSPLDNLDPELLNRLVFAPILQITDLRKDKRVKFIGGKADVDYLVSEVDSGKFRAAFLSHPVPFSQFKAIADAGLVMPPKSTWFEPKFPSALVIYPLHEV